MSAQKPDRWTSERAKILDALTDRDPDAADLYRVAVDSLAGDLTRPSLMVASHCLRELIRVLPVLLNYATIEHADASRAARELHKLWTASELPLGPHETFEADAVSVPSDVFAAARDVARAGADGSQNSRKLTALIVTGQSGEAGTAAVGRVHKSIEHFRAWSHARDYTKPEQGLPMMGKVLQELSIIEEALLNRLSNMADRTKSMRSLLALANQKAEDNPQ